MSTKRQEKRREERKENKITNSLPESAPFEFMGKRARQIRYLAKKRLLEKEKELETSQKEE